MKTLVLTASLLVSLLCPGLALGQTVVPLNTGFNHSANAVYAPQTQDKFWLNMSTSPTPTPPAGPSSVIQSSAPWLPPLPAVGGVPATNWISAWPTIGGHVDPLTSKGYTLFRKCFCMMSFSQAKIVFDVRADDNITIWLNGLSNTLLAVSSGQYSNPTPIHVQTTDQSKFKIGVNCLYVLLEDIGGYMGFDLRGTVSAYGLMPMPGMSVGSGTDVTFAPCGCDFRAARSAAPNTRAAFDDENVIKAIVKIAEARRNAKASPAKK